MSLEENTDKFRNRYLNFFFLFDLLVQLLFLFFVKVFQSLSGGFFLVITVFQQFHHFFRELFDLNFIQKAQSKFLKNVFQGFKLNNNDVRVILLFNSLDKGRHEMFGKIYSQRSVFCLDCSDQVGKAFTCFFLYIFVGMFFDDGAKKIHSLFDIWIVEFFQLFDKDVKHRNSNFGFLSFISVDIFIIFFFIIFIFLKSTVDHGNFFLNNLFNKHKQAGKNFVKIRSQVFSVDQAKSLPTSQDVSLLRISLFKLRALKLNHQVN